jgi:hypothetical protein
MLYYECRGIRRDEFNTVSNSPVYLYKCWLYTNSNGFIEVKDATNSGDIVFTLIPIEISFTASHISIVGADTRDAKKVMKYCFIPKSEL